MVGRQWLAWLLIALVVTLVGGTGTAIAHHPPGDKGCTPGFWKNHTESWLSPWTPSTTLETAFDVPDDYGLDATQLLTALKFGGGPGALGAAQILLRAGVAALLNAQEFGSNYPMTVGQVQTAVSNALATHNRQVMLALAENLDDKNNSTCPLP